MTDSPELIPVPTVQELVRRGFATALLVDKQGNVTIARLHTKGHDLMGKSLRENGRRMRDHDKARKVSHETSTPPELPSDDPWPAWE